MVFRLVVVLAFIWLLPSGIVRAEDMNPVVGKTGDFILREADFDRLISYQPAEAQKSIQNNPDQRTAFIRQILLTKAIAAKARNDKFEKKPEIREVISYLIDQYLAQEYLGKVVAPSASLPDEEMKKYYTTHEKDFVLPETAKVRHIFITAAKDSSAEVMNKARMKAEELLRKIKAGEDFSKIANEYSEDSDTAAKGGDLGSLSVGKTNSREFENAVFALKPGETSSVVETPFGFHIIRVDEKREKRTASFDEAKGYIQTLLSEQNKQKKNQEFIESLVKESGLEVIGEKGTTTR